MSLVYSLRDSLRQHALDAFLVVNPENRAYLSGFTGSSGWLLVTVNIAQLITDFRYYEQAVLQAPEFQLIRQTESLSLTLQNQLKELGIHKLGFEQDHISYGQATALITDNPQVEFIALSTVIEGQRMRKTDEEVDKMQKAADISEHTFLHILSFMQAGMTELAVSLEMERYMRQMGAEGLAFESIVASGPRSSLPHGRPTDRVLEDGDFVTLDFGAKYKGYCSDMTRTLVIGKASEEQRKIYQIVYEAHMTALQAVKPGILGKDLDMIARNVITAAGYGEYFGHGLGHGVGRNVHEGPSCGKAGNQPLESGNIITIEPGIYIPNWGGVRIEDMVLVTDEGHRNFNHTTKALIEI
jgi:Xaa-Pro aminopeptidase